MTIASGLLLLSLVSVPSSAPAAEPARLRAAATLEGVLGSPAIEVLERRGIILTTGPGKGRRLTAVQWDALKAVTAAGPRLKSFLAAYDAARRGKDPEDPADAYADIAGLRSGLLGGGILDAQAAVADRARARAAGADGAAELKAAGDRLSRLERDGDMRRQFDDLRTLAARLADAGDLPDRLKSLLSEEDAPAAVRLDAPELHLRGADSAPFEPADTVVFTVAYWVDGLAAKTDTEVVELLYLDRGARGMSLVGRSAQKRSAGGPYTVAVNAVLPEAGKLTYRLVIDASEGVPLSRETVVDVSPELDALRLDAAAAEQSARACRLDEAAAAWAAVIGKLVGSAKPARLRVLADARARLKAVDAWQGLKHSLADSLDGARLYATPERCEYRSDRADRALSLLKSLPAGCDRDSGAEPGAAAELVRLARDTASRRRLQEAFSAATAQARDREASCRPQEAARLYASALALLDSDPATRCGDFEREYAAVRLSDLPRAAGAERMGASLEGELANAHKRFAAGDPAGALAVLHPLSTALRRLPDARCWSEALRKADELAKAAGVALGPKDGPGLKAALPADDPSAAVAEARRDWDRRQAEHAVQRDAAESLQSPHTAGGAP